MNLVFSHVFFVVVVVVKNRGNTALHYAFAFGFQQLGKYLASNGADDTLLNDQG